jgi:phage tail sheath protein FI
MPEYLAPGVYIEEIERGPRPIEGVSTSTAAFLGETERGPTTPRLVTSFNEYRRYFGGAFGTGKYMPDALSGFFANGGHRAFICRIVKQGTLPATLAFGQLQLVAAGPGDWGTGIHARVDDGTTIAKTAAGGTAPIGFRLRVAYWQSTLPTGSSYPNPFDSADNAKLPRPTLIEDFDDLSWDPASPDYYVKRLQGNSALVALASTKADAPRVTKRDDLGENIGKGLQPFVAGAAATGAPPASPAPAASTTPPAGSTPPASTPSTAGPTTPPSGGGGGDVAGPPGVNDYKGEADELDQRTGLSALELDAYREVALVAAPGITDQAICDALITHCENSRYRFAVLDSEAHKGNPSDISPRDKWDTSYGAYYFPWVMTSDLQSGVPRLVPPSGHVLGLYARTDDERGVWKAPANDILRGVFDLEYPINADQQGILNPKGVNVIRQFPGRGIRVWGARTLSSNSLWKYVSVRRLFIFLEHSIYEGTQWVVFEPNDEKLWARVKDTIRLFLRTQWRNGAMMGLTEDEAFTIACDRSTMTQDDILNGRLVCEIGIAPVRPAEFVIFRIFQNTAEAQG